MSARRRRSSARRRRSTRRSAVRAALAQALQIPLDVEVSRAKLRRYVEKLARRFDREAVDARRRAQGDQAALVEAQDGRKLRCERGSEPASSLATHIATRSRSSSTSPSRRSGSSRRACDRHPPRFEEPAATGGRRSSSAASASPPASRRIRPRSATTRSRPCSATRGGTRRRPDWAADSDPVPPGPGNPLGTRWMGISAPYVGIHGTPDAASIGYSASHGCIRMRIPEAEWLFQHVDVGTPVFIVAGGDVSRRLLARRAGRGRRARRPALRAAALEARRRRGRSDRGGDLARRAPDAPDFTLERLDQDGRARAPP